MTATRLLDREDPKFGTNRPEVGVEAKLVTDVVRRFAQEAAPDDRSVADWAVGQALRSLRAGAPVGAACRNGRRVIARRVRLEVETP